jgi:hypothetical protein
MARNPAAASRTVGLLILLLCLCTAKQALGQGGDGSLRGTVKDSQGGALPGVTVIATSAMMLSPSVTVTDSSGNYRLINLPPGTFRVTAELAGFSQFQRDGILLRAASNFQVDITMEIGAVSETVTVSGDAPMLEVSKPGSVLTIDAEFQKEAPVVEGKFWSDFLMLTPGVISRPHNDASGRQNYFGNAVEHRDAVTLMEGLYAGNYNDFNINRTGLGGPWRSRARSLTCSTRDTSQSTAARGRTGTTTRRRLRPTPTRKRRARPRSKSRPDSEGESQ